MNKKEFKREIAMGFGSVIKFLQNNPHLSNQYDSLILWACSNDLRYDTQVEAMRSQYLFDIINSSENRDSLELEILTRVMNNRKGYDVDQLLELAVLIYKNGNSKAKDVIYEKFDQLYSLLLKKNTYDDYYSYLLNECADSIISIDGLTGLEYISLQYGKILANHNKECIDDYHFIHMKWYWFDEVFEQGTINLFFESNSKKIIS